MTNLAKNSLVRSFSYCFRSKTYLCFPRAQQPFPDVDPFEMEGYLVDGFRLHQPVNCPDQLYTVRKLSLICVRALFNPPHSEKVVLGQSLALFNPPPLQVMVSCWAGRAQHRAAIPTLYSHLKQFSAQLQQFV